MKKFGGEEEEGGDVYQRLGKLGPDAADLFGELKEKAHTGEGDQRLVRRTEVLVKQLRQALS